MTEERRGHARKRISASVTFTTGGGAPLRGWLRDISRSGCFVATQSKLPVGELFELEFRLPGMFDAITGKARVVWLREKAINDLPAGMGVAFVDVPAQKLDAIDRMSSPSVARARSKTMVGVAPPPAASSPSFSPEVPEEPNVAEEPKKPAEAAGEDHDTAAEGVPVVEDITDVVPMPLQAEAAEPPPPPVPSPAPPPAAPPAPVAPPPPFPPPPPVPLPPSKRRNARWIALGGVVLLLGAGVAGLVKAVRGCGPGADAGPALDVAVEAEPQAADAVAGGEEEEEDATPDVSAAAPMPAVDAGHDAGKDAGHDAGRDAGHDAGKDAGHGGHDAGKKDAGKGKRHGAH